MHEALGKVSSCFGIILQVAWSCVVLRGGKELQFRCLESVKRTLAGSDPGDPCGQAGF